MNKLELCQKLIEEAMRCLSNGDKQCTMRLIGEMIRLGCHDGRVVGREIANEVGELVHRLWLGSDHVERYEVMTWLMGLNVSKTWKMRAIFKSKNPRAFNNYVRRYVTEWNPANSQVIQSTSVKVRSIIAIEELLRRELGWNELEMCMRMWRFIGVNVKDFEEHGIDLCEWLDKLTANELTDARWLGWHYTDLKVSRWNQSLDLILDTTNTISAVHFPAVLRQIKIPSIKIYRGSRGLILEYFINIPETDWPWPLDKRVAIELLRKFNKMDLVKALAAMVDGDGYVGYRKGSPLFRVTFGKDNVHEASLIKEMLWQLGIKASITGTNVECWGDNAVQILSELLPYMTHPLRSLRTKLILMYRSKELNRNAFNELYGPIKYEDPNDPKRNNALTVATQAAPQTHTHGTIIFLTPNTQPP